MAEVKLPISEGAEKGITAEGANPRTAADIISEFEGDISSRLGGKSFKLDFNQLLGAILEAVAKLLEGIEFMATLVFAATFIDYTFGSHMDDYASTKGASRNPATNSGTDDYEIRGTTGVVLPAGTVFKTNSDIKFRTLSDVTMNSDSYTAVSIESLEKGSGNGAAANTVTIIEEANTDIIDARNPTDIEPGQDVEGDDTFRERLRVIANATSGRSTNAIRSAVRRVSTVTDAMVYENNTKENINIGTKTLEPGDIYPVVFGSGEVEIAAAIFDSMSGGDPLIGDKTVAVKSKSGQSVNVKYQEGQSVPIYIKVVSNPPVTNVGEDIKTGIRTSILDYINNFLKPGVKVDFEQCENICTNPFIINSDTTTVTIGKTSDPSSSVDIPIGIEENSLIYESNIVFEGFN